MTRTKPRRLPDSYFDLVRRHPLRSIRDEASLDVAQEIINELLRSPLDSGQEAYLDALSDLVMLYEREHHPVDPLPPNEMLAYLLEDRAMSQADLVRATGIAKATVSDLVGGKRAFTVRQMQLIGSALGVPSEAFMPMATN